MGFWYQVGAEGVKGPFLRHGAGTGGRGPFQGTERSTWNHSPGGCCIGHRVQGRHVGSWVVSGAHHPSEGPRRRGCTLEGRAWWGTGGEDALSLNRVEFEAPSGPSGAID